MWHHTIIFIVSIFVVNVVNAQLVGDHVCLEEERYNINVTEYITKNATVRKYKWCLNVPPRCSYYTTKTINEPQIVEKTFTRLVEKCCNGFEQLENSCISICPDCINGRCQERTCICYPGFKGPNCNTACEENRWGPNCTNKCDCIEGTCDKKTGFCECHPGWNGTKCSVECPRGYFGQFCTEKCKCNENEVCNNKNGDCIQLTTLPIMENTSVSLTTPSTDLSTKSPNVITYVNNGKFELSTIQINNNFDLSTIYQTSTERTTNFIVNEDTTETIMNLSEVVRTETRNYLLHETHELINDINTDNISDNSLNEIGIITACGVFVIIIAVLLLIIRRYRSSKEKNRKTSTQMEKTTYRESIFHTPLPEPPSFSNPSYTSPYLTPTNEPTLHNINFHNQTEKDCKKYLYDHPPSTGSYRAASLPDPTEIDSRLNMETTTTTRTEPVYDEIPNRCEFEKEPGSIYMNTFGKTKF